MASSRKVLEFAVSGACFLLLLAGLPAGASEKPSSAQAEKAQPCSAPEYRQFDFWAGKWEVFEIDGQTPVAHVTQNPKTKPL